MLVLLVSLGVRSIHERPPRLDASVATRVHPGDIRMIASVGCVYCRAARAWFVDNRLPFSECLIENDADCASLYQALRSPGTPVLVVRGRPIVGFHPQAVVDALAEPS